jgi:radical SAM-linked protein
MFLDFKRIKLARMRLRFSRTGKAKWISHLEQIRILREIVKNSGVDYTHQNFKKTVIPKMSFGPAIPAGYQSESEYADLFLHSRTEEEEVYSQIKKSSMEGLDLLQIKRIPLRFPSIELLINTAEYEISGNPIGQIAKNDISEFLDKESILIVKTKPNGLSETIDAKRLIIRLEKENDETLKLLLGFGPKQNVKPEKIVSRLLNIEDEKSLLENMNFLRKQLYWRNDLGELQTPLN